MAVRHPNLVPLSLKHDDIANVLREMLRDKGAGHPAAVRRAFGIPPRGTFGEDLKKMTARHKKTRTPPGLSVEHLKQYLKGRGLVASDEQLAAFFQTLDPRAAPAGILYVPWEVIHRRLVDKEYSRLTWHAQRQQDAADAEVARRGDLAWSQTKHYTAHAAIDSGKPRVGRYAGRPWQSTRAQRREKEGELDPASPAAVAALESKLVGALEQRGRRGERSGNRLRHFLQIFGMPTVSRKAFRQGLRDLNIYVPSDSANELYQTLARALPGAEEAGGKVRARDLARRVLDREYPADAARHRRVLGRGAPGLAPELEFPLPTGFPSARGQDWEDRGAGGLDGSGNDIRFLKGKHYSAAVAHATVRRPRTAPPGGGGGGAGAGVGEAAASAAAAAAAAATATATAASSPSGFAVTEIPEGARPGLPQYHWTLGQIRQALRRKVAERGNKSGYFVKRTYQTLGRPVGGFDARKLKAALARLGMHVPVEAAEALLREAADKGHPFKDGRIDGLAFVQSLVEKDHSLAPESHGGVLDSGWTASGIDPTSDPASCSVPGPASVRIRRSGGYLSDLAGTDPASAPRVGIRTMHIAGTGVGAPSPSSSTMMAATTTTTTTTVSSLRPSTRAATTNSGGGRRRRPNTSHQKGRPPSRGGAASMTLGAMSRPATSASNQQRGHRSRFPPDVNDFAMPTVTLSPGKAERLPGGVYLQHRYMGKQQASI